MTGILKDNYPRMSAPSLRKEWIEAFTQDGSERSFLSLEEYFPPETDFQECQLPE